MTGAAAGVVALLALVACTPDEGTTGVPHTAQQTTTGSSSVQPSVAVPSATTAPDAPSASAPVSTGPAATSAPATTATDLPTTVTTTQTTGLTGNPPDPTSGPRTKQFGGVTTYADKSAIRVEPPQPFTPTGGAAGRHVVLTITVVNNSPVAAPIDFWYISAQVDGQPVEPVTDRAQGVGMPSGDLAPGQQRTFKLAYPKTPGQLLVLEVVWRDGYPFTYQA